MWQGFTPTFRRVIELAHAEAARAGYPVDDDSLLAGLLFEGDSDAARLLLARGVSLELVRAALSPGEISEPARHAPVTKRSPHASDSVSPDALLPATRWQVELGDTADHVPFTASAKRAIDFANDESIYHGGPVSAEHLLLALIRNNGSAARLLETAADDGLRSELVALLDRPTGGDRQAASSSPKCCPES